jgi:hypothetical protein
MVVGDHVTHLSRSDNKSLAAMKAHSKTEDRPFVFEPVPERTAPPVLVVIKKRRVPVPPK